MRKWILGLLVFAAALAAYLFLPETFPEGARRCAAITVFAAGFWALDLVPVYVTSLIVVLLLCFSLGKPGGVLNMDATGYTVFLAPFSSPVLMLFFGGFVLAGALTKHHCDRFMASRILIWFTRSQPTFLFGVMLTTAFLSMWISNTAATIIMLSIVHAIFEDHSLTDHFRKGVVLAIPFSANIGGIATPIGTPPNALAMGFLSDYGILMTFPKWIALCLPLMVLLLIVSWLILTRLFVGNESRSSIPFDTSASLSGDGFKTLGVAGFTILLWLSTPFHGIPEALIALFAAGVLMALGLIDRNNIKNIDWDVLILMWGGLALGVGIEKSQLGQVMIETYFPQWQGAFFGLFFATFALILSLFISNTAAAALIIPLALEAAPDSRLLFGVTIALMCSSAMIFPVSTPPNALAYGTGIISNREMIRAGSMITLCCYLLIALGFWWIIPLIM